LSRKRPDRKVRAPYVRDDNDVVMTAIVSGIIGAVIANVFVN
jgi:hypothetical protein